jgi:hypothetical protein
LGIYDSCQRSEGFDDIFKELLKSFDKKRCYLKEFHEGWRKISYEIPQAMIKAGKKA